MPLPVTLLNKVRLVRFFFETTSLFSREFFYSFPSASVVALVILFNLEESSHFFLFRRG